MKIIISAAFSSLIFLTACGSPQAPPDAITPVATAGAIAISEPRVRLPIEGRDQTAAYLTLRNTGAQPDRLVGVSSPIATKLELHAHLKTDDGLTAMREVTGIDVPIAASIPLSPGGLHIMVKGLRQPLKIGDNMVVRLTFASGAAAELNVPVVSNPRAEEEGLQPQEKHAH